MVRRWFDDGSTMVRRWFDEKLTTQAHHPSSPPKLTNLAQHGFPLIFVLDFVNYRLAAVIEAYSFR